MGRQGVEHATERSQIRGRGGRIRENEWGPSPLLSGKWRVPMPGTVQWQGGWVIPLDWVSIDPRKWDCQAIFGPLDAWEKAGPAPCRRAVLRAVQAIIGTIDRPLTPDPIRQPSERKWSESCSPFPLTYIGHRSSKCFPSSNRSILNSIIQSLNRANSLSLLTRSFALNFLGEMFRDCKR